MMGKQHEKQIRIKDLKGKFKSNNVLKEIKFPK